MFLFMVLMGFMLLLYIFFNMISFGFIEFFNVGDFFLLMLFFFWWIMLCFWYIGEFLDVMLSFLCLLSMSMNFFLMDLNL